MVSREEQLAEALRRMEMLDLHADTIEDFKAGKLSVAEPPSGDCRPIKEEELEEVRKFEKKHNAMVYLVVRTNSRFGRMDSYLHISKYPDEWRRERDGLRDHRDVIAYVRDLDFPDYPEMGFITIRTTDTGGVLRIR